jgi:DNA-binding CsgD family transcriptional regulator
MVGRTGEQTELAAALAAAQEGSGRLLLIGGPAGIGKTRLAEAAVVGAGPLGLHVARGYAIDDPGAPPLWPWLRLIRGWPGADSLPLGDLGRPGDQAGLGASDAAARFQLFVAVSDLLYARAADTGLLLVLEDMHWADRMSALLLRHLVAELGEHRLAVVVTHRDSSSGPLADVLPDLLRGATARPITLPGLSVPEVGAWLPQLTGTVADPALAAELHERTGGNPLLIRLVAEDLAARATPDDPTALERLMTDRPQLRRLVVAKVEPLGADARHLIDAASVLGERIFPDPLASMIDRSRNEVDGLLAEALGIGVLRETADGTQFEHALVRDAVYGELSRAQRDTLHRRAAEALAAASAPAGPIATHWQRVDGSAAIAHCQSWAEAADDQARAALAYDDATRFADLAVDCALRRGASDEERARVLVRLAEALLLSNRIEASMQACVEAADLAEESGRADLLARAALVVHGVGHPLFAQLIPSICERALALVDDGDHTTRARLLAQVAVGLAESEGGSRPADLAGEALAEADQSGDPAAILEAIAARHIAISIPSTVTERLELGRRAVELGVSAQQPIAALWGHLWRAGAALQLGNIAEFDRETDEIDRVARKRGSELARWHHHRHVAMRAAMIGDFGLARRANVAASDLGLRVGDVSLFGLSVAFAGQMAVLRGDADEMPADWEEMISFAPSMPLVRISFPMQHAVAGELDLARAEFEAFRDIPASFPVGVRWAPTVYMVGLTAVLLDDAEVAASAYTALLDTGAYYGGDGSGGMFCHGANARMLGDLARVAGKHDDALPHYRRSVPMNVRAGARPFTALSRLGWAQTLVAIDRERDPEDGQAATELLAQATAEFRRLDMPGPLATAAALTGTLRTARRTASPLTARESEIAGLVAQAMSNRGIAGRLYLSERTVETHVRSILAKLGFTTRTEIATWVLRTGPG